MSYTTRFKHNILLIIITYVACTVGVVIGALHAISDLTSPGSLALSLRDQLGVGILHVIWDLSQNTSTSFSPPSHQGLGTSRIFLRCDSDWLNLDGKVFI